MATDCAVLAVYSNSRKISYMLICTGKLIKEGSLSTVLISYKRVGEQCALRKRVSISLGMELSALTKSRVKCSATGS